MPVEINLTRPRVDARAGFVPGEGVRLEDEGEEREDAEGHGPDRGLH